jgi:hypothetical protein
MNGEGYAFFFWHRHQYWRMIDGCTGESARWCHYTWDKRKRL